MTSLPSCFSTVASSFCSHLISLSQHESVLYTLLIGLSVHWLFRPSAAGISIYLRSLVLGMLLNIELYQGLAITDCGRGDPSVYAAELVLCVPCPLQ